MEFVFKNALQSVVSTKIHFKHPPCNGSTVLCLPVLFGLLLSVVNGRSTHYFNIANAFANVVLLPSTEGFNQLQLTETTFGHLTTWHLGRVLLGCCITSITTRYGACPHRISL